MIISASKGIEHGSLLTVSAILKGLSSREVAALSGPSFAKEVVRKFPTAVTLAADNPETGLLLQEIFNTNFFRVYTHNDVIGVELGGALKNVIAIASGISDGLGLGHNARAALITRGLAEIMRLGKAAGANDKTFSGLSGLGDLVLTCTGPLSRNYSVGVSLGKGMKLKDILAATKSVAEGWRLPCPHLNLHGNTGLKCRLSKRSIESCIRTKTPDEPRPQVGILIKEPL